MIAQTERVRQTQLTIMAEKQEVITDFSPLISEPPRCKAVKCVVNSPFEEFHEQTDIE